MESIRHACLVSLCALAASGSAVAQHGHSDFCDPATATAEPVLRIGDFDGDGAVRREDVRLIKEQVGTGDYIAFFDRNADGSLDAEDVEITESEIGKSSSKRDQQLADAFRATRAYRDQSNAIDDNFIPLTQSFYGHGSHWIRHPKTGSLDYSFDAGDPEGLNYDADGRLWGIFYYYGPSGTRPDGTKYPPGDRFKAFAEAPKGFVGDSDIWHYHAGICIKGLNYEDPSMDPRKLSFREGLSPRQCLPAGTVDEGRLFTSSTKWSPKIYMIHAWLHELNPCGAFAGAHPELATASAHPDTARPHGKIDTRDPDPEFQFAGGTLCAWLNEIGRAPNSCFRQR